MGAAENTFKQKILSKKPGIITYGMTPPKASHAPEKVSEIAQKQVERLKNLDLDALILYDVQEEVDRVDHERPYPYLPTIDPAVYGDKYLRQVEVPKIILGASVMILELSSRIGLKLTKMKIDFPCMWALRQVNKR